MDRIQKIAILQYDKKMLEEKISQFSVEYPETAFTLTQKSKIAILNEEIRKIDEMIDKREHQTDQVYNSEMLSRFLKIIKDDGQLDEEAKEWWQTRY